MSKRLNYFGNWEGTAKPINDNPPSIRVTMLESENKYLRTRIRELENLLRANLIPLPEELE